MTITMTMAAAMAALGQSWACQRKAGRDDQRRCERKFLHHVLHWGERICPLSERTVRS
jgi:hypothetical protein